MNVPGDQPLILSASRTRDMVRRSPQLLAKLLLGEAPCRWGPYAPFGQVDPHRLHTVVLWTKDPRNLLDSPDLHAALVALKEEHRVQISLQVTATGLGGGFIEPGIPHWRDVLEALKRIFNEGLVSPAAVIYRFDPFLSVRTPSGRILSNACIEIFTELCGSFVRIGIARVVVSRADAVRYPRVRARLKSLGLDWIHIEDAKAVDLCRQMAETCRGFGADFSVCCEPDTGPLRKRWGCIDGKWLSEIKGTEYPAATEILHNQIGKQRPLCRCTYSRDIGYSTGSAGCYSGGYGCLYCYSQGQAKPPRIENIAEEIAAFDEDPTAYLKSKNLPPELCQSQ
jgi:hypothetical protein